MLSVCTVWITVGREKNLTSELSDLLGGREVCCLLPCKAADIVTVGLPVPFAHITHVLVILFYSIWLYDLLELEYPLCCGHFLLFSVILTVFWLVALLVHILLLQETITTTVWMTQQQELQLQSWEVVLVLEMPLSWTWHLSVQLNTCSNHRVSWAHLKEVLPTLVMS